MVKRILVAFVLLAIGLPVVYFGGIPYFFLIAIFIVGAAWEYVRIFRAISLAPSMWLTIAGVLLILLARYFFPAYAIPVLAFTILAAMAVHLVEFERGSEHSATDFAVTVSALVYIGWIGAYLLDLRMLDGRDGCWYLLLVLGVIWLADAGAYFYGSRFGRHKMVPRLSPKKTWEGYWAGVVIGTLGGAGLAVLWHALGGPDVRWWQGGLLGLVLSVVTALGDLGESMIKRQAGVKDSSNVIPGHGGFFDRIDSWLWGAVMGYFIIIWFIR